MKTLKLLLMCIFLGTLLYACTDSSNILGNELQTEIASENLNQPHEETVPFKATFLGEYQPFGDRCEGALNVIVDAVGEGTHIGRSTVHFDFCGVPMYDGSFVYFDTETILVSANGDELYATGEGIVIPGRTPDHPQYVTSYWRDKFFITGGTGRFKGASGELWTDDYNSSEDPYSHHNWEGTITMVKGKRK